jgi:hypothetical protein
VVEEYQKHRHLVPIDRSLTLHELRLSELKGFIYETSVFKAHVSHGVEAIMKVLEGTLLSRATAKTSPVRRRTRWSRPAARLRASDWKALQRKVRQHGELSTCKHLPSTDSLCRSLVAVAFWSERLARVALLRASRFLTLDSSCVVPSAAVGADPFVGELAGGRVWARTRRQAGLRAFQARAASAGSRRLAPSGN